MSDETLKNDVATETEKAAETETKASEPAEQAGPATPDAAQDSAPRCAICHPRIFTVRGEQRVMWNFDGIQVSMSVAKAMDLLQHFNNGLIYQLTGLDLYKFGDALAEKLKQADKERTETADENGGKEYVN